MKNKTKKKSSHPIKDMGEKIVEGSEFTLFKIKGEDDRILKMAKDRWSFEKGRQRTRETTKDIKKLSKIGIPMVDVKMNQTQVSLEGRGIHITENVKPLSKVPLVELQKYFNNVFAYEKKAEKNGLALELEMDNWGIDEKGRLKYRDFHYIDIKNTPMPVPPLVTSVNSLLGRARKRYTQGEYAKIKSMVYEAINKNWKKDGEKLIKEINKTAKTMEERGI